MRAFLRSMLFLAVGLTSTTPTSAQAQDGTPESNMLALLRSACLDNADDFEKVAGLASREGWSPDATASARWSVSVGPDAFTVSIVRDSEAEQAYPPRCRVESPTLDYGLAFLAIRNIEGAIPVDDAVSAGERTATWRLTAGRVPVRMSLTGSLGWGAGGRIEVSRDEAVETR